MVVVCLSCVQLCHELITANSYKEITERIECLILFIATVTTPNFFVPYFTHSHVVDLFITNIFTYLLSYCVFVLFSWLQTGLKVWMLVK